MAFYPGQERVLPQNIIPLVDYFHMMSYDAAGKHSTMEFAIKVPLSSYLICIINRVS